ncbi:Methyltransferase-like protein 7B [Blyttiomyces sp. JEL0837]|nr:Methyltransferase-like protein 7B [Blyttiomyces sp. JEL0837]
MTANKRGPSPGPSSAGQSSPFQKILSHPRTIPILAGGVFIYFATAYITLHAVRIYNLPMPSEGSDDDIEKMKKQRAAVDGSVVYSGIAKEYDEKIEWDEWLLGIKKMRRKIGDMVEGNVLEIASGTGRNLQSYSTNNTKITSLTLTDSNPHMLERAYEKYKPLSKQLPPTKFLLQNASNISSISESNDNNNIITKFDTVVDTFGLCSFEDPVTAVVEMAKVTKPGGRIILLEHGRSLASSCWGITWPPSFVLKYLNIALDKTAKSHACRWGCWWNRDVEGIVREACLKSGGGLVVEEVVRKHLGTTVLVKARKV